VEFVRGYLAVFDPGSVEDGSPETLDNCDVGLIVRETDEGEVRMIPLPKNSVVLPVGKGAEVLDGIALSEVTSPDEISAPVGPDEGVKLKKLEETEARGQ
jgi:hypothetical protein